MSEGMGLNGSLVETRAYIGLGANLGDRAGTIAKAVAGLDAHDAIRVVGRSRLYETCAVGGPADQPLFLNAAVGVETTLTPRELLDVLLGLEQDLGRVRTETWGARTIDLDLLLYGDRIVEEPDLIVPHPRLHERGFVLGPLAEIAMDVRHPKFGRTIGEMLQDFGADWTGPS